MIDKNCIHINLKSFKNSKEFSDSFLRLLVTIARNKMGNNKYQIFNLKFVGSTAVILINTPFLYPYINKDVNFENIYNIFFHLYKDNVIHFHILY
jgi:hypothetical protein